MNSESAIEPSSRASSEARQPLSDLRCEVEADIECLESLQSEWDEAVLRLGGPVYMSFDWLKTWLKYYGAGRQVRLFLFRLENQLVGLVPVYIESFGIGPFKVNVARLVGASIPPKTFNPAVDPAFANEVFANVLKHLFSDDDCDLFSLGPVSERWPSMEAFRSACAAVGEVLDSVDYQSRATQTIFELPATFEDYLAQLSSSERKSRVKRIRHLEKDHQVTLRRVSEPELIEPEFENFLNLHAQQWKAIGKGGHFEAWPCAEAFNRDLVRSQGHRGRVHFFQMLVDGQVVASRYTFLFGSTLYSELPARKTGESWDRLGIGAISMIKFNQQLIEAGITSVDSGLGGYDHKSRMGGEEIPVGIWRVVSCRSAAKVKLFLMIGWALSLVCHKIWYRRILPRLPQSWRRTQVLTYLRFDV